ncbi:uncharacterized protein LOC108117018 isoform X1 [Drosophila eugracilis]|uniref:uncharacterized protein LOC108117018 isoform X1 n=1 Tax=Drosophila eugracilis TaxID=29029 RepID=UPI001BD9EED4|nr:uncharacterized protein LOC108117018 isoform X1 [Drosophila eugracilis]
MAEGAEEFRGSICDCVVTSTKKTNNNAETKTENRRKLPRFDYTATPWSEDLTRRQLLQFFEGPADGYSGHSSASSRVSVCVFITLVDYAYKNYTSPRSQPRAPEPQQRIPPVAREITTELFLLWFVPLLFNGPEDHTQSHALLHRSLNRKNPTQRNATRLNRNSTLSLPRGGTQNSVLLLKITLLLFIYTFSALSAAHSLSPNFNFYMFITIIIA